MVSHITSNEYLKRVDNMTAVEREEYMNRVGEWTNNQAPLLMPKMDDDAARFQNVIQCSAGWNDAECQAWTEGARLLTALAGKADTWLPEKLYVKAAKRAIGLMLQQLKLQAQNENGNLNVNDNENTVKEVLAEGTTKATQAGTVSPAGKPQDTVKEAEPAGKPQDAVKPVPVRPKHIDQYVHLLPESTQKKAAQVQGILRDIDTARENARLLAKANEHPDTIAQWAKATAELDKKLKTIYRELDAEWEKLVMAGCVTVDDFGNAHVIKGSEEGVKEGSEKGSAAGAEPETSATSAKPTRKEIKAAEKAKRLEYLKKWLRDTRTTPSIERKKMWEKNCKELISLGGEITDSIRKAAEFYGVGLAAPKE